MPSVKEKKNKNSHMSQHQSWRKRGTAFQFKVALRQTKKKRKFPNLISEKPSLPQVPMILQVHCHSTDLFRADYLPDTVRH